MESAAVEAMAAVWSSAHSLPPAAASLLAVVEAADSASFTQVTCVHGSERRCLSLPYISGVTHDAPRLTPGCAGWPRKPCGRVALAHRPLHPRRHPPHRPSPIGGDGGCVGVDGTRVGQLRHPRQLAAGHAWRRRAPCRERRQPLRHGRGQGLAESRVGAHGRQSRGAAARRLRA